MSGDVGELGFSASQLRKAMGTFPLHQGQQGFTQEL
jgi:hypothetical protein